MKPFRCYDLCTKVLHDKRSLLFKRIHHLNNSDLLELTNKLFLMAASLNGLDTNPSDFVTLVLTSMKVLQEHNKSNVLYKFAYCLGSKKPGTDEPLFPLKRIPFAVVEYQIEFFSCTNIMQVTTICVHCCMLQGKDLFPWWIMCVFEIRIKQTTGLGFWRKN